MSRNQRLRRLIAREEILIAPGIYDAYLARCVERAGFEATYMTGAGVSHSRLGVPDLGLLSFAEMVESGKTPILPAEKLEALGFSVAIHPGSIGRFIGKQVGMFLEQFKKERSTLSQMDRMLTFAEQNEIVDLQAYLDRAKRYLA